MSQKKRFDEKYGYDKSSVGKSLHQSRGGIKLENIFGNLRNGSGGRTKDTKQKCKSAKYRTQMQVTENGGGKEKTIEQEIAALDESLISDDSGDEFDSMVKVSDVYFVILTIIYQLVVFQYYS